MSQVAEPTDNTVRLVREMSAPPAEVYDAFLDPEKLVRWIGPGGPDETRVEAGTAVGASTDIWIQKEEGEKRHFHWEIAELDPPRRLVFDFAFGGPIGSDLTGYRSRLTVEFRESGPGTTELTLVHDRLPPETVSGVNTGWGTITGRLAEFLKKDKETEAPEGEDS